MLQGIQPSATFGSQISRFFHSTGNPLQCGLHLKRSQCRNPFIRSRALRTSILESALAVTIHSSTVINQNTIPFLGVSCSLFLEISNFVRVHRLPLLLGNDRLQFVLCKIANVRWRHTRYNRSHINTPGEGFEIDNIELVMHSMAAVGNFINGMMQTSITSVATTRLGFKIYQGLYSTTVRTGTSTLRVTQPLYCFLR